MDKQVEMMVEAFDGSSVELYTHGVRDEQVCVEKPAHMATLGEVAAYRKARMSLYMKGYMPASI